MAGAQAPAFWQAGARIPPWARVLEPLYRALQCLHRWVYALGLRRPWRAPVPVIVVGNLTAGGSGKTPLVLVLAEALRAQGWHPGVVSRGYGRADRDPRVVSADSRADAVGDEPLLVARQARVPVAVAARRADAVRLLLHESVDIVLCDDGLQHRALARDIEIIVVDGRRRFGNGHLLPAGPLREPPSRLRRVDFVVCNGGDAQPGEIAMALQAQPWRALQPVAGREPPAAGAAVHAVAGLGDPERFFASLQALGYRVNPHPFPDHHAFHPGDFAFDDGALPVVMTDKDAVKCAAFARAHWWVAPVRAQLPASFLEALRVRLPAPPPGGGMAGPGTAGVGAPLV